MTTHLRGRAIQAGAFLALVIGGIAVAPAIAMAAPGDPAVQILDVAPTSVASGGKVTMHYTVTNGNLLDTDASGADIKVTGMDCGCDQFVTIKKGETQQFTANLTAPTVPDGQTQRVQIQVRVTINNRSGSANAPTITVKGDDKPKTVRQISGKVKDQDGKAISGARVLMQDSGGNRYETNSNGSGLYTFTSNDSEPIVPGKITVGATKAGFEARSVDVQGSADRTVNVPLTLKSDVAASPSATESPSPSTAVSSPPAEVLQPEAPAPAAAATTATANTAANQKDSGGSTMFIVLGGLLVAAGIGAIVLVMMRRKNSSGDDPDGFGGPGGGGGPMPSGPARYADQTRVGAPMGGGRADATMVAPMSGAPSISDAPTMLHRPVPAVEDEFPDPYGVPIPQQGGYAGTNNWDHQPAGYGAEAAQYGAGAYGANGQQYGQESSEDPYAAYEAAPVAPAAQRRYDEPTGMYRPESTPDPGYGADGYDQHDGYGAGAQQYGGQYAAQPEPTGAYGAQPEPANGYPADGYGQEPVDEQAGYGQWGAPGSGIDSGNAYGPQSGGYGAPQQQHYDADPYAEPTGYDQQAAPYNGYEQPQQPEYDQRPRRGAQPPQRRPPEWDN